jgi:hypothetical protein
MFGFSTLKQKRLRALIEEASMYFEIQALALEQAKSRLESETIDDVFGINKMTVETATFAKRFKAAKKAIEESEET